MRIPAAALGAVALTVVAFGWLQNPGRITADEAVTAAKHAFAASGLRNARVDDQAASAVFTAEGGRRVLVWKTTAAIAGGTVELWMAKSDGESLFLDDRAPDGASQLLTDRQFERLGAHYENPAVPRQVRRNILLTGAAVLVALLAACVAMSVPQGEPAPTRTPSPPATPPAQPRRARPLRAHQEPA